MTEPRIPDADKPPVEDTIMAVDEEVSATRWWMLIVAGALTLAGGASFFLEAPGHRTIGVTLIGLAIGAATIALIAPPIARWLVSRGRKPA